MTGNPLVQPNHPSLVTLNAPLADPNWGMEQSAASPTFLLASYGWQSEPETVILGHGGRSAFVASTEVRCETHF